LDHCDRPQKPATQSALQTQSSLVAGIDVQERKHSQFGQGPWMARAFWHLKHVPKSAGSHGPVHPDGRADGISGAGQSGISNMGHRWPGIHGTGLIIGAGQEGISNMFQRCSATLAHDGSLVPSNKAAQARA